MASEDDRGRAAMDHLAERIATSAEPALAASLTNGKHKQVDSETAHRIAANAARDHERRQGGK